jgi:hypothetical protein
VNSLLVLLGVVALFTALSNWRLALLMALGAGFAQDVARKLTPGEPVYMVMLFAPVFAAAVLGLMLRGGSLSPRAMFELHPRLRAPVLVFLLVVAVQVLVTLGNTGSMMLAGIGVLVYVLPFVALVFAMYYASHSSDIGLAFGVYVLISVMFCVGVYLNVLGYQDGVLDTVGQGLFVYPDEGGVIKLPSGFFRSAETAAWHGATAAALAGLLVATRQFPGGAIAGALVIAFLVGAVVLTGRRKMVVELCIFATLFAAFLAFYRRRGVRLGMLLTLVALLAYGGQLALIPEQTEIDLRPYVSRYETVAEEASARLRNNTVDSFKWVIQRNGLFGSGAGTASQGAAQFGGGVRLVGYAAEGGLSKVLAELGVHGLLAALWVAVAVAMACHVSIRRLQDAGDLRRATLAMGLAALLLSNMAVFATASQVFGDPFVLLILGLSLGFVLRGPASPAPGPGTA